MWPWIAAPGIAAIGRMEERLAKMTLLAAGIFLSSALALAAPGKAAPDCKTSTDASACPTPKAAKPDIGAKASPPAKPGAGPKPRPEPEIVRRAAPPDKNKQAAAKKSQQNLAAHQTARHSAPDRTYAQAWRGYRRESRQDWQPYSDGRDHGSLGYRPGPVYDAAPGAMAGGYGCDYACQYRAWFERYSAWYDRYGRTYDAQPRGGANYPARPGPAPGDNAPLAGLYRPDQSAHNRLDPWHGYNGRDGLENGY